MNDRHSVSVSELKCLIDNKQSVILIDVRERSEYRFCHIEGSKLIPLNDLPARISELDVNAEYIVYCHTGQRSAWAVEYLMKCGVNKARNLQGGIDAWAERVDLSMARY